MKKLRRLVSRMILRWNKYCVAFCNFFSFLFFFIKIFIFILKKYFTTKARLRSKELERMLYVLIFQEGFVMQILIFINATGEMELK